jgi:hypothetical protein
MSTLTIATDYGEYDVLPKREIDDCGPDMATHVVFAEDGSVAGFASDSGIAWDADGTPFAYTGGLRAAAARVAESDRDAAWMAAHPTVYRLPLPVVPRECSECSATAEEWPLTVQGHRLMIACAACHVAVAAVVAVAASGDPAGDLP